LVHNIIVVTLDQKLENRSTTSLFVKVCLYRTRPRTPLGGVRERMV